MNKDIYIKLLQDPASVSNQDMEALENVLKNFPYCQTANILVAKANHDKGSMFSNQKIKRAAVFSASRQTLRNLIVSNKELQEGFSSAEASETSDLVSETIIEPVKPPEPAPVIVIKEESAAENDNAILLEEILKSLNSLHGKEKQFWDKENIAYDPGKHSLKEDAAEIKPEIKISDDQSKKKLVSGDSQVSNLKFYIHSRNFGKDIRIAESDLISEYLSYRQEEFVPKPPIETQTAIIDKFLTENPQLPRFTELIDNSAKVDLSKKSTIESDDFVSENLANIFVKQGKLKKAIEVYEKLKLKYPDKSAYFAEKIEYLQSLNK